MFVFLFQSRKYLAPKAVLQPDNLQCQRLTSLVIISLVRWQNCFCQRIHTGIVQITTVFPESTVWLFSICTYLAGFFPPMCKHCQGDPQFALNCVACGLGGSPNRGWCKCVGTFLQWVLKPDLVSSTYGFFPCITSFHLRTCILNVYLV